MKSTLISSLLRTFEPICKNGTAMIARIFSNFDLWWASPKQELQHQPLKHPRFSEPSCWYPGGTSIHGRWGEKTVGIKSESASESNMASKEVATQFQIASYNVYMGDLRAGRVFPKERMTAIVECIQRECLACSDIPLLFIGFQELTPLLVGYLEPQLSQLGYDLCTQVLPEDDLSHGVGMAVPRDLEVVEYQFIPYTNTEQKRGLLYVKTPTMLLATTHLESYGRLSPEAMLETCARREEQIIEAARFCDSQLEQGSSIKFATVIGDFNWDDELKRGQPPNRKLQLLLPDGWQDPGKPFDFTYDSKENPMLRGSLRRRLDRCIYKYKDNHELDFLEFKKIGLDPILGLEFQKQHRYKDISWPSAVSPCDHYGIVVSFGKPRRKE